MRIISPYSYPQRWLKGCLHAHTSVSDGALAPAEVIAKYRFDNYDFLAITDHAAIWDGDSRAEDGMLILPGAEFNTKPAPDGFVYHIVALGVSEAVPATETGQEVVDAINSQGGLVILAHPRWSLMSYELFEALQGCAIFEVYNGGCEKEVARGFSHDYWDKYMTRFRRPLWAVSVDDAHAYTYDFGTGWTCVNARKTPEDIYGALRRGDFYASSGPRIETIRVEDSRITVCTSSAKAVKFISLHGEVVHSVDGEHVKRASYEPKGNEVFVRVEVHGHDGRIAWTNPFFIEP